MTTQNRTLTRIATPATGSLLGRLVKAIVSAETGWRHRAQLRRQTPEALKDMGITPDEANADFYRARGNGRADVDPIRVTNYW